MEGFILENDRPLGKNFEDVVPRLEDRVRPCIPRHAELLRISKIPQELGSA